MSGGAFNYLYYKVEEVADEMEDIEIIELTKDFANLLYEAEWYKSGDTGKGEYNQAVKEFKDKWLKNSTKQVIIDQKLEDLRKQLHDSFGDKKFCHDCKNWTHKEKDSCYGKCKHCQSYMKHAYDDACENYINK